MKDFFAMYVYRIMLDEEHGFFSFFLKPILFLLSRIYAKGIEVRTLLYDMGILKVYRSDRKVISVGNITVGGVGKTPMVARIVKHLGARTRGCAVIMRGYMAKDGVESDEAQMLREMISGVYVATNSNRAQLMQQADKEHIIEAFVLDDGFQHWQVARDLDIVVIDATNPFGNKQLLPRGILREPMSALKRADIIILTRADIGAENVSYLRQVCTRFNPRVAVAEAVHAPVGVTKLFSNDKNLPLSVLEGNVCGLCAIGTPDSFRATLEQVGARVAGFVAYIDHHVYTAKEICHLVAQCKANGVGKIVTTHKDAVKLSKFQEQFYGVDVFVLNVEVRVTNGKNELISRIDSLFNS